MKKILYYLMLLFIANNSFSQVNLQTGAAQSSISLYSYTNTANRLGLNISLDYISGNGLKVSSMASSVGTGWNLTCGGYIERMQNGEPDDQKNYDVSPYPLNMPLASTDPFWNDWSRNYSPDGYLYSSYSPSDQISNAGAYTPMFPLYFRYYKPNPLYQADREQDIFKFSFNGHEGYFIISKKNAGGINEIRTLYDSKLKIEKVDGDLNNTQNIRTTISQFIITDENGIRYLFGDANLDQVCEYNHNNYLVAEQSSYYSTYPLVTSMSLTPYPNSTTKTVRRGWDRPSYVKNKWYLTEISNPLTNIKIQFQYETYNVDIEGNKTLKYSAYNSSGGSKNISITLERIKGVAKRLKKIVLPTNESVVFDYSSSNRLDLDFDKCLLNLNILHGDRLKYKWSFEYGYFIKNSIRALTDNFTDEDKVWSRLCLTKAKRATLYGSVEPPYLFSYYMGNEDGKNSAVPPMFSVLQDLRGYYSTAYFGYYSPSNGLRSVANSPYEPNIGSLYPNSYYIDLVKYLYYNASGSGSTFQELTPSIEARNGILKTIQNPLGGTLDFQYELNTEGASPSKVYYGVRVSKTIEFDGVNHSNDKIFEYKYIKEDGSSSAWGHEFVVNNEVTPTRMYDCGSDARPANNPTSVARPVVSYIFSNGLTTTALAGTTNIAGAAIPNVFIAIAVNILIDLFSDWFGNSGSSYQDFNITTYNSYQINNGNNLPFQYARVEVVPEAGSSNNGKTVYEFTSPSTSASYAIDFPASSYPYASKQRFAYWIYSLPQKISIYDKDNKLLRQTINTYNPIKSLLINDLYKSQKWAPSQYVYACSFNAPSSELSQYDKIASDIYYPITGRIELTETKEYAYNNNDYSLVTTDYEYSTDNYQVKKITTTNSKGEVVEANTYYPTDYTLSGAIQSLKNSNMLNVPVSTQTFITRNGNTYLLNGAVNEFGSTTVGDIKPINSYSYQSTTPIAKSAVLFVSNQLIPNSQYYTLNQSFLYTANGLPNQISKYNGSTIRQLISNLYDYDNKLLIAQATNANLSDIAYTSFEADGKGGWDFTGYTQNGKSPTGNRSYILNSGSITKSSLNTQQTYIVSYWSKNGAYTVSGTISGWPKPLRVINIDNDSWTLFEHKITGLSTVTISGSGNLDELRLYPEGVEMTTCTYDPVKEVVTSTCSSDNRLAYYQYDGFGRLLLVMNDDRKILKQYCYNYSGQPENCHIYGNVQKMGSFYRGTCGSGYIGDLFTYTVLANSYYATTTQEEADALAQAEIDANGQGDANNKGNCVQGWYNESQTALLAKSDCSPGYTSSGTITYTAPAGTYSSTISQADANYKALLAAIAAGQPVANNTLSCVPANGIMYSYNSYSGQTAKFTNTTTGIVYQYNIPIGNNVVLGLIPTGTYNIQITAPAFHTVQFCDYSGSSLASVNFSNVVVNSSNSSCLVLRIN